MVNLDATKVGNKGDIINFLFDFILDITNSLAYKWLALTLDSFSTKAFITCVKARIF